MRFKDSFNRLLGVCLSGNCISAFAPQGHLHRFVQHLICIQLFWYQEITEEFGTNFAWVVGWNERARKAQLKDPLDDDAAPEVILEEWSRLIRQRGHALNHRIDETDMSNCTFKGLFDKIVVAANRSSDVLVSQQRMSEEIKSVFGEMRADITDLQKESTSARSALVNEHHKNLQLQEEVRRLRAKTASLKSPSSSPSKSSSATPPAPEVQVFKPASEKFSLVMQHQHVENNTGSVVFGSALALASQTLDSSHQTEQQKLSLPVAKAAPTKRQPSAMHLLKGHSSKQDQKGKIRIHTLLGLLRQMNWFRSCPGYKFGDRQRRVHLSCKDVSAKFVYCMELLDTVLEDHPAERRMLLTEPSNDHPTKADHDLCDKLRTLMMDQMHRFEDSDPEVQRQIEKKRPGSCHKSTVCALGQRIKNYKVLVRSALEMEPLKRGQLDDTPLVKGVKPGLGKGTPPGLTSLRAHFPAVGKENNKTRKENDGPNKRRRVDLEIQEAAEDSAL